MGNYKREIENKVTFLQSKYEILYNISNKRYIYLREGNIILAYILFGSKPKVSIL